MASVELGSEFLTDNTRSPFFAIYGRNGLDGPDGRWRESQPHDTRSKELLLLEIAPFVFTTCHFFRVLPVLSVRSVSPSIAADSPNSTDPVFGKKTDFAENALAFSTFEKYCKDKRQDAAIIDRLTGRIGRQDHPEFINYSIFHVNI